MIDDCELKACGVASEVKVDGELHKIVDESELPACIVGSNAKEVDSELRNELLACGVGSEVKEVDQELRKIVDESELLTCGIGSEVKDDFNEHRKELLACGVGPEVKEVDGELLKIIDESVLLACGVGSEVKEVDSELRKIIDEIEVEICEASSESNAIEGELSRIIDDESSAIDGEFLKLIDERESQTAAVTSESNKIDGELRTNDESESGSCGVTSESEESDGELLKLINLSESPSSEATSESDEVDRELQTMVDKSRSQCCQVLSESKETDGELLRVIDESESGSAEVKPESFKVDREFRMIDESEPQSSEAASELNGADKDIQIDSKISNPRECLFSLTEDEVCKKIPTEIDQSIKRDSRVRYTRKCLLSLAEENVCKKLPTGIRLSIVSELKDLFDSVPENPMLQGHEPLSTFVAPGATTRKSSERWDSCKFSSIDTGDASGASTQESSDRRNSPNLNSTTADTGGAYGATTRDSSERWGSHKFSSICTGGASGTTTRDSCGRQNNINLNSVTTDPVGAFGASTRESSERWDSFKLNSIDSKSTDPGRHNEINFRRTWQIPGTTGILDSSSQISERGGILGSWSGIMRTPSGSEVSTLECQGTKGLLSRCSEPYRPPSFYKAMSHTGMQSHDSCKNETHGSAEGTAKQRATEDRWRKDSLELPMIRDLQGSEEKQKSTQYDDSLKPKADTCAMQEDQCLPNSNSPPILPAKCLKEDLPNYLPLPQMAMLQPQVLEGGRFSALISLEDSESVDPDLIDGFCVSLLQEAAKSKKIQPLKTNLEPNDKSQGGWRVMHYGVGSNHLQKGSRAHAASIANSKENKNRNVFHDNTPEEKAVKSSTVEASVSLATSVKPSVKASYQPISAAQQKKVIDDAPKGLQKSSAGLTYATHQSEAAIDISDDSEPEIWQSSHCTKTLDIIKDSRDFHNSRSRFIPMFSDNDKVSRNVSSGGDQIGSNVWRASSGMLQKGNVSGQEQSKKAFLYASKPTFNEGTRSGFQEYGNLWSTERNNCFHSKMSHDSLNDQKPELAKVSTHKGSGVASAGISTSLIMEGSRFNPTSDSGGESEMKSQINLPDEDSLITIDDTFIIEEGIPILASTISSRGGRSTSAFPCTKKPTGLKSLHQKSSLPSTRFHKLYGNPPDTQDHTEIPHAIQEPWKISHGIYDGFSADAASFQQPPMVPHIYEPTLQRPPSPRMPQAQSFYPCLGNKFLADPSVYPHVHQIPRGQQQADLLGSHPLDYYQNVEPAYVGKKGIFAEEGTRPTYSQVLRLQIKMAQMNIDATPGFKQRMFGNSISDPLW